MGTGNGGSIYVDVWRELAPGVRLEVIAVALLHGVSTAEAVELLIRRGLEGEPSRGRRPGDGR